MGSDDDVFDPFGLQEAKSSSPLLKGSSHQKTSDFQFDPFALDDDENESNASPVAPPAVSRISRTSSARGTGVGVPLPPKITIKLTIHEEACSMAFATDEGASEVSIEGTVKAQVQCSDAKRNAPFRLISDISTLRLSSLFCSDGSDIINIPKHEIGLVQIADYSCSKQILHMPLLLERKITVEDTSVRIAIQVRSKLSNLGKLQNFSIVLAVPELIDGESIEIVKGQGSYDELKRMVHWKLPELQKGESFVLSAHAQLWEATADYVQCPVMLRCESEHDPISGAQFQVVAADGHPASVTCNTVYSFRLLNRLP